MNIDLDSIKDILIAGIPINLSGGEVTLSVGESLLLVLDACKKGRADSSIIDPLKQLYLEGIKTVDDRIFIEEIKALLSNKNYVVKSEPSTINADPTRLYFETKLAYKLLQQNAESLDHDDLNQFTKNLKRRLFSLSSADKSFRMKIEKILKGDMDTKLLNKYELEYAELNNKLLKRDFYGLSDVACKNLYEISCSTILATMTTQLDHSMPVDIYTDSVFTMGMDGRGRLMKVTNELVSTTAKGLMRSTTPLPLYDDTTNPVDDYQRNSLPKSKVSFQRSADQSTFMIESGWSQHVFSHLVHPYSNGISSTTLAQLRNIILQKRLGNQDFAGSFQKFLTTFAALMLYNSGGHSFFEIFEVLKLSVCRELIDGEPGLTEALLNDHLMYKFLCEDQKISFDSALQETLAYAHTILIRKLLNAEHGKKHTVHNVIDNSRQTSSPSISYLSPLVSANLNLQGESSLNAIHRAVINADIDTFERVVVATGRRQIDIRNHKNWTALMVASQLGKTEKVKMLLAAGANIKASSGNLSPLDLAIKNGKFDTVIVLLSANAMIKNKTGGVTLKERFSALYYACRQDDMRILRAVLGYEPRISMQDKLDAIFTALKVENIDSLRVIIESVSEKDKQKYFTIDFKSKLLNKAVHLGNTKLMQAIMYLQFTPAADQVDYDQLFQTAAAKGYLPVAKHIMGLFQHEDVSAPIPLSKINLDKALVAALKNNFFDMAVLCIIYGASTDSIPSNGRFLRAFDEYLKTSKRLDVLFNIKDFEIIASRADSISKNLHSRLNSILYPVLKHLVTFLNFLLPDIWRLGFNDKTMVIEDLSTLFKSKIKRHESSESDDVIQPVGPEIETAVQLGKFPGRFFANSKAPDDRPEPGLTQHQIVVR